MDASADAVAVALADPLRVGTDVALPLKVTVALPEAEREGLAEFVGQALALGLRVAVGDADADEDAVAEGEKRSKGRSHMGLKRLVQDSSFRKGRGPADDQIRSSAHASTPLTLFGSPT
jgi:hypothetical protein